MAWFKKGLFLLPLYLSCIAEAWAGPSLVVSIRPLHSLVSSLTEGVTQPRLLIRGVASPHLYRLKPSDMRMLETATAVIWIGPAMESGLIQALQAVPADHVLTLLDAPQIVKWPMRQGGSYQQALPLSQEADPHVWLDVQNAVRITDVLLDFLQRLDPAHAIQYGHNADRLKRKLIALDAALKRQLAPLRAHAFLWGHDSFQYLEHAYGLRALGSVSVHADQRPGIHRLLELQHLIETENVCCILVEQGSPDPVVDNLLSEGDLVLCQPDPLGLALVPGKSLYLELMANLANQLVECLSGTRPRSLEGSSGFRGLVNVRIQTVLE